MLSESDLREAIDIREKLLEIKETNKLQTYSPYPYQKEFHEKGRENPQRLLMAGNRVGKTMCGAMEMAIHATGLYPDWWEGRRFNRPIRAWCAGNSNDKTRDICQAQLLGQPDDPHDLGKGAIPKDKIGKTARKPGIPNALNSVLVKHVTGGWSRIGFKAYEMGPEAFMGEALDVIWLDEEPPQAVYSQALTRILDRGGLDYMTFTPENGMTSVVAQFVNNLQPGQALIRATWDDAPHLTPKVKEQILAAYGPHEREMRSKGIPALGSGLVWPIPEDQISCEYFDIPKQWPRICGIDFGVDHPTAAVWIAWNKESDRLYVYDCYRANRTTIADHAHALKQRGQIPVAWPHDGMVQDRNSGIGLAEQYRNEGVRMLPKHFTNPDGTISLEPGIQAIYQRMASGTFKVFDHLKEWFEEFRSYHRSNGKIVKERDDLMSATRYAAQSLRFADNGEKKQLQRQTVAEYDPFEV